MQGAAKDEACTKDNPVRTEKDSLVLGEVKVDGLEETVPVVEVGNYILGNQAN